MAAPAVALEHQPVTHGGSACLASAGVLLLAACGAPDVTRLEATLLAAPEAAELELALQENQGELDAAQLESEALAAQLSEPELRAALAGAPLPSVEALRRDREALAAATLGEGEQAAILTQLGPGDDEDSRVAFQGRLVMQGDVLRLADDLLGNTAPPFVAKANLHLTVATNTVDRNGNPIPGGPARPDLFSLVLNDRLYFWRPDTGRRYYIVVPNDVPDTYFYAFVLAAYALEAAHPTDCLANLFTVIRADAYAALHPLLRARSSLIEVGFSTTACLELASGCANSPRVEAWSVRTGVVEKRMRLGSYIGLETDYDSPRDADQDPELTPERARNVILHELSHILGFDHPRYSELDPELDTFVARVPQSSQGTVPSFMFTTADPLFSAAPSAEDRRVLTRAYSGYCAYRPEFRLLGELCSALAEQRCHRHGGSCEAARTSTNERVERCRWHNFTDEAACGRYSAGLWETESASVPSTVFGGEAGACLASALPECIPDSFVVSDQPFAGRCCTLFGDDEPGLMFGAFSDDSASHYFCSDQKGLGDPGDSWEFVDAAELGDFTPLDAATGTSAPGWSVLDGDLVQEQDLPGNLAMSRERMRSGCVLTRVRTDAAGESGIVFNFRTARNYYVFDVLPNVRRRIRQVVDGVSTDLSVEPWTGPASWADSIGLGVCYGDGVHTFIDEQASSRISIEQRVSFVGTGGRVGLWNEHNPAARHDYLRTYSLVEGFSLIE